jgi:D-lactate dehydrogenase
LKTVELFAPLSEAVLSDVAHAVERGSVDAGERLFCEGDPGDYMFIVKRGYMEVRKAGEGGTEVTLRWMGPGEVGGLTSMALPKRRSATLRARDDVVVLRIARERFLALVANHPELVAAVMAFLSSKVRGKTYQLATLLEGRASDDRVRVAVFDAKTYDRESFTASAARSPDLSLHFFETKLGPSTAGLASGFPVVCAFVNDDLGTETLEQLAASGVQLVAMRCAGYNNVDLDAACRLHISVARVPAYSPHAVAEHAVALLLTLNRKTHRAYNRVREGNFSLQGLVGFDLHGRTAGIVGLGKIGRCLAEVLVGFGMRVVAYDAVPDADCARRLGIELVELDALVERSDVISLHAPLLPQTHHMINGARIARMKPGVVIINTSRGGLIDAAALIQGLKHGPIGAAGLDVYEEESEYFFEDRSDRVVLDDLLARLMTFPNVLITSHQGFLTGEALGNIADTTLANIREFLEGKRGDALTNAVLPHGS